MNRGLAILDNSLFFGSLDGYLVAINANTGKVNWQTQVAKSSEGFSLTGAPLVVGHSVIIGVAGGDYGVRGFLAAYDVMTGQQQWKFDTIPGPGEAGPRDVAERSLENAVAVELGLLELMTHRLISFTGGSVTLRQLSPVMSAPVTTFSPTAWLRCMRVPGSLHGIFNLHPTTNTTGIQPKRRYLPIY